MIRSESIPSGKWRDHDDELKVLQILQRFKVFSPDSSIKTLHNIATVYLTREKIQEFILNAEQMGQEQLNASV